MAPQLHMMTSPGGYGGGHHLPTSSPEHHHSVGGGTDANRKRAVRLQKNREAARECRRKKKEYIKCLENRVAVLENQNKALIEELRSLKELYSGKGFASHEVLIKTVDVVLSKYLNRSGKLLKTRVAVLRFYFNENFKMI